MWPCCSSLPDSLPDFVPWLPVAALSLFTKPTQLRLSLYDAQVWTDSLWIAAAATSPG